ncbi:hypothetical protein BC831DRAFT_294740 [Entophlyctis helioformis]|nr:hypothetical protein BC831DRAFT_294740 [Entophlyctis helioformis]
MLAYVYTCVGQGRDKGCQADFFLIEKSEAATAAWQAPGILTASRPRARKRKVVAAAPKAMTADASPPSTPMVDSGAPIRCRSADASPVPLPLLPALHTASSNASAAPHHEHWPSEATACLTPTRGCPLDPPTATAPDAQMSTPVSCPHIHAADDAACGHDATTPEASSATPQPPQPLPMPDFDESPQSVSIWSALSKRVRRRTVSKSMKLCATTPSPSINSSCQSALKTGQRMTMPPLDGKHPLTLATIISFLETVMPETQMDTIRLEMRSKGLFLPPPYKWQYPFPSDFGARTGRRVDGNDSGVDDVSERQFLWYAYESCRLLQDAQMERSLEVVGAWLADREAAVTSSATDGLDDVDVSVTETDTTVDTEPGSV